VSPENTSDMSMEFFTDPRSYDDFSRTKDFKRIITCIDPRLPGGTDEKTPPPFDEYKVTVQTDGGAAGLGHDRSLRIGVETGQPEPISEGIRYDARVRITNVLDAHHECRFLNGIVSVLGEEADPNDFTLDAIKRWEKIYGIGVFGTKAFRQLRDSAARQAELEQNIQETKSILEVVDELYPEHPNVRYMAGENRARLHVVNHHPFVGIDRRRQAKLYGENAQGYHNNLAAIVERSLLLPNLSRRGRMLRAGAAIMRAAATMTVVTQGHEDTRFLEVFPEVEHGLRFDEKAAA
jgi:hypothetical protein